MSEKTKDKDDSLPYKKAEKHGTTISLLAGFIVVLVLVSILAYKSGIDPKKMKEDIAAFQTKITEAYAAEGVNVGFSYKAVDAEGGLFEKSIIITEPQITVQSEKVAYTLSTSQAVIIPGDDKYHAFDIKLASPVTIHNAKDGFSFKLVSSKVLEASFEHIKDGQYAYMIGWPEVANVEIVRSGRMSNYEIKATADSSVSGEFTYGKISPYAVSMDVKNASITKDKVATDLAHVAYNLTTSKDSKLEELSVKTLKSDLIPADISPVSIDFTRRSTIDLTNGDEHFDIEQFLISGNGFNFDIRGGLTIKTAELLPLVDVTVAMTGADKVVNAMKTADYIAPTISQVIVNSLKRIVPEWHENITTPVEFTIKRTAAEPFMIGAIKADELFAIALKEYISSGVGSPVEGLLAPSEQVTEPSLEGNIQPGQPQPDVSTPAAPATDTTGATQPQVIAPDADAGSANDQSPAETSTPIEPVPSDDTSAPAIDFEEGNSNPPADASISADTQPDPVITEGEAR